LIPTLAKLDHLLTLLTQPRHLDAISRRLKLLLVDLDRAAALSRRNGTALPSDTSPAPQTVTLSAADHANLTRLFNLLPRLDPLLPLLPPLIARLRSLAGLHAEASAFAGTLKSLQADRTKLADRDTETRDVIEGLQKGLQEAEGAVKANWDVVGGRLAQLEDRVEALL
jgi:nuclear migration protein JNM1